MQKLCSAPMGEKEKGVYTVCFWDGIVGEGVMRWNKNGAKPWGIQLVRIAFEDCKDHRGEFGKDRIFCVNRGIGEKKWNLSWAAEARYGVIRLEWAFLIFDG